MIGDTSIDGRPLIHSSWPEHGEPVDNGPVHTLEETASYMREHGMPRATKQTIMDIERTAFRKLRHHPAMQAIIRDRRYA